jgi:hypothetical protein
MALQPMLFLPPILGHETQETLPEHHYEGHFFR